MRRRGMKWCGASLLALTALTVTTGNPSGGASAAGDAPGCATDAGDQPGIDDGRVVLGSSAPLSGPVSANAGAPQAMQAWAAMLNAEQGGVTMADGVTREVDLIVYDDAYDPALTVQNVRRLVEEDEVFALWAIIGTPPNLAVYDYTNDAEVPHLFAASGASAWGRGFLDDHPWTIGWQPAYSTESAIFARYLVENHPDATVAILRQNDDYGADYLSGFEAAIDGTAIEIVAEQTYEVTDPTVDQQMTELAASDADVFFNISTPRFAAQAIARLGQLSWDPIQLLNSPSASPSAVLEPAGFENAEGVISAQYTKVLTDPRWDDDEIAAYRDDVAEFAPDLDANDPIVVFGWAQALSMQYVLEHSFPTRQCLVETAGSLDGVEIPLLLPGITLSTGPDDGFPLESMQIVRFEDGQYVPVGEPVSYEGSTPVVG